MKCCTVEHLNFTRIQVRWKILFYRIPQFIYESTGERIIKIGPHCQSYRKNKSDTFFMAHGVVTNKENNHQQDII